MQSPTITATVTPIPGIMIASQDFDFPMGVVFSNPDAPYKANFTFQTDGNLVDYDENGTARWASNTDGRGARCTFQADGNLVVYDANNNPLWASNTDGHPGDYLAIQDDGNVVIYDPPANPLWATGTNH